MRAALVLFNPVPIQLLVRLKTKNWLKKNIFDKKSYLNKKREKR
jgi:hypothetical protein